MSNFAEVERGYTDEPAQAEAARCLACGVCSECLSCQYICAGGCDEPRHGWPDRDGPGGRGHPGARLSALSGRAVRRVRLGPLSQRGDRAAVRAAVECLRPDPRPRDAAVGPQTGQKDRLSAVRRLAGPGPRLLLVGLLHVRHQRGDHGHRARAGHRGARLYDGHALLQQGIRRILSSGAEEIRHPVYTLPHLGRASKARDGQPGGALCSGRPDRRRGIRPGGALGRHGDFGIGPYAGAATGRSGWTSMALPAPIPLSPLQTSRPGVYAIGPFREPKDIPESVVEASGAAAAAAGLLAPARGTLATRKRVSTRARYLHGRSRGSACLSATAGPTLAAFWTCRQWPNTRAPFPASCTPSTISTPAPRTRSSISPSR